MTCSGCQAKVQALLSAVQQVKHVTIDLPKGEASIDMESHIPTTRLQDALKAYPAYHLEEKQRHHQMEPLHQEETISWLVTYKPVLLVFAYILGITLLIEAARGSFDAALWMQHFMAGFFLVFSFFKMLDLRGFADSYATYDIIAKKVTNWGYAYAFIELGLGIAYLLHANPLLTNLATLLVMGISIIGVLQSVLNKRKIKCACLGAVFNVPMSTITIIEDALMMVMSAAMLSRML